jgi:lipopolysaccharide transport system ATP-binding protein
MQADTAILVEHIRKQFRLGRLQNEYPTLRESLSSAARGFAARIGRFGRRQPGSQPDSETIWALDDVSLSVRQGEIVGIIGPNGAGKTTLLKILARITEPTSGRARVRGRLGSLLEVGTGFHFELTGRENVFLSGAILGMRRSEIRRRFDEIVAFSELERFIDTPVKFYSSGMYLRLAFAVAAHLEPEVLLVDEVLAVGDASFQQKCIARMDNVAKHGRTILFVSHNMTAIENLCDRAIWISQGRIVNDGRAEQVVADYLRTVSNVLLERHWPERKTAPGNDFVRIHGARVRPLHRSVGDEINVKTPIVVEFEYWSEQPTARLIPSVHVFNDQGVIVFNVGPVERSAWQQRPDGPALIRDICHIPADLLNDGTYRVSFCLSKGHDLVYCHDDLLVFGVRDTIEERHAWYGKWVGAIRPVLEWRTEVLEAQALRSESVRRFS